jgi:hypothetical protein
MRLSIAAFAIVFFASSGSAMAADCTKGMLWPYVRNPGDCLTEDEIKTGVYQGAPTTNNGSVDVNNIKAAPAAPAVECHTSGIWPFRGTECTQIDTPPPATAAASAPPPAPVAQPVTAKSAPAVECHSTGIWPFRGTECMQPEQATPATAGASAPPPAPAAQPPAAPAPKPQAAATPAPARQLAIPVALIVVAQAAPAADCRKGLLWPFVRDNGDCSTTVEQGQSSTTAVPVSAPAPAVATAPPSAPTPVAAQSTPAPVASCGKSLFWPFVRDNGDCSTTVEKGQSSTTAVPVSAPAPAVATAPPPAPTPVAAQSTPASAASCGKSLFWPFVRDSGDCSTTAEKGQSSTTAVPVSAPAPAGAPAPTPAANTAGGCHKGLFWPFVRDDGDCSTDADRSAGNPPHS